MILGSISGNIIPGREQKPLGLCSWLSGEKLEAINLYIRRGQSN